MDKYIICFYNPTTKGYQIYGVIAENSVIAVEKVLSLFPADIDIENVTPLDKLQWIV